MDSELSAWKQQAGRLADVQLMAELQQFVRVDRSREAQLLVLLAEVDARKLYLAEGCSSLFRYNRGRRSHSRRTEQGWVRGCAVSSCCAGPCSGD